MSYDETEILIRQIELCKELRVQSAQPMVIMGMDTILVTKNGKTYLSVEYEIPDTDRQTLINVMKEAIEVQRKIQKV